MISKKTDCSNKLLIKRAALIKVMYNKFMGDIESNQIPVDYIFGEPSTTLNQSGSSLENSKPKPENSVLPDSKESEPKSLSKRALAYLSDMEGKIEDKIVNRMASKYLKNKEDQKPSDVLKHQIRVNAVRSGVLLGGACTFFMQGEQQIPALMLYVTALGAFESRQLYKAYKNYKEKDK